MGAYQQLLGLISQILFALIAVVVTARAIRQPWKASIDTALLFTVIAVLVVIGWTDEALGITPGRVLNALISSLLMSLPYLLVRLVDDFAELPPYLRQTAAIGLALAVVGLFSAPPPYPAPLVLYCVLYFIGLTTYVALAFIRATRHSSGVTKRRMQAVAAGSLGLGLIILLAGVAVAAPGWAAWLGILTTVCGLLCGLFFFLGFAPPSWLRRTWQEPEVRAFLGRAAVLPRLPDTLRIVRELEQGAAGSLGVANAVIGLYDPDAGVMRYFGGRPTPLETRADQLIAGRAFVGQRPVFSADAARDDPENAQTYRAAGANAILAAPITAGEKRLGVLSAFAPRAPIFADDDLQLVSLLANQAAVILESRALIDEAARVRAREEAARLKDDFLSAAAHDLKTPLTSLVAQAQLMERRARRNPGAPADLAGIERIVGEAQRLRRLVLDLLDVARVEQGKLVSQREVVDLVQLAREACARHGTEMHPCLLEAPAGLDGEYDRTRILQLLDNLLENAVKYNPAGGQVRVRVWVDGASACLSVTDSGIGIPAADLPHLFDRFHRGSNVDDRRFAGMGLGLYICRGIVEQHGGSIWASSGGDGRGSTFHVVLPAGVRSGVVTQPQTAGADSEVGALQVAIEQAP